jgi:hypothetical protein
LKKISMPLIAPPQLELAKGFLMHKMYHLGYVAGKHTSVDNLPKSSPPDLRPFIPKARHELMREGLLVPKSTSYGEHVYAVANARGYEYANVYEKHAGLPLAEHGKPPATRKAKPLSNEQLRKLLKRS